MIRIRGKEGGAPRPRTVTMTGPHGRSVKRSIPGLAMSNGKGASSSVSRCYFGEVHVRTGRKPMAPVGSVKITKSSCVREV
jgi:hypothetical protein